MCDTSLSSECCLEPKPPTCPPDDCVSCPTVLLASITNVFLIASDFGFYRVNQVVLLLRRHPFLPCGWVLESQDDVLVSDVDFTGDCIEFTPTEAIWAANLRCEPLDLDDANWRFTFSSSSQLGNPGCFFLPATDDCPIGRFTPCAEGVVEFAECFWQGQGCEPQNWCGPPNGSVTIALP